MQRFKWFVLFALVMALTSPTLSVAQDDMGEAHKQALLRVNDEGFNQGDPAIVDEVFAPDYVSYNSATGAEGDRDSFKAFIEGLHAAMPDIKGEMDLFVVEGDWVSFRHTLVGTFENELYMFPGLPPTGESVVIIAHVTVRFNEDGQIVEEWDLVDDLGFLTQLGIIPPTGE
jgi:predicted ester cyclase